MSLTVRLSIYRQCIYNADIITGLLKYVAPVGYVNNAIYLKDILQITSTITYRAGKATKMNRSQDAL